MTSRRPTTGCPTVSVIVAIAENGVIGSGGQLPWHLPADLRRFKSLTTGHHLVMGRKTFESIGRPLPNRVSIVISRRCCYRAPGAKVARSLDRALELAAADDEVFVIGGVQIYQLALPRADRLYLTLVHAEVDGDTILSDLDLAQWTLVEEEHHPADSRHQYPFTFQTYDKANSPSRRPPTTSPCSA